MFAAKGSRRIGNCCINDNQAKAIEHLLRLPQVVWILESGQDLSAGDSGDAGFCGNSLEIISGLLYAVDMVYKDIVDLEKGKPTCQIGKIMNVLRALGVNVRIDMPETGASQE